MSAYINVIDTAKVIAEADRQKAKAAAEKAVQNLKPYQIEALQ